MNLTLERLRRDYIGTNQALEGEGNEESPLLYLPFLSDLAGSSSVDEEFKVCHPPRIRSLHDKDENPDVEAASIKKGALELAEESGIFMSKEVFDGILCCIFNLGRCVYNAVTFHTYNDNGQELFIN
jgi:hypothetical protein